MSLEPAATALPDRTSAVAIVTTFHPEPGMIDRLTPILGQVGRVLIVDKRIRRGGAGRDPDARGSGRG